MRKVIYMVLSIFVLVSISYSAVIKRINPTRFKTNGDRIGSWYWLRSPGHFAEWVVPSPGLRVSAGDKAVFCFSTLSTNTVNGGAGFDSSLIITLYSKNGRRIDTSALHLKNACSCLKDYARRRGVYFSRGVGYKSYGCVLLKTPGCNSRNPIWIRVRVRYKGGHHTAVRKDSLKVFYVPRYH